MLRTFLAAGVLSLAGTSVSHAAEILVPGDTPFLQQAIDLANPGDVIRVTWPNLNGVVTIDKPLTILGDPVCNMDVGCGFPAITLAGSGAGTVVLEGVHADTTIDCAQAQTQIVGGGFAELHMYDCVVATPPAGLTGYGSGGYGMSVSVPFLLLEGCSVTASGTSSDTCTWPVWDSTPYHGIVGPGTVVALDSTVVGGSPSFLCCNGCPCVGLPPDLGNGGAGIVANQVYQAGSGVSGGTGTNFLSNGVLCATYANGPAVVASTSYTWADDVGTSSPFIPLGGQWTLSWDLPGPMAFLYASFDPGPPFAYGAEFVGIGPVTFPLFPVVTGAPVSLTINISGNPALAGLEIGLQFLKSDGTLSRPVFGVHVP